VKVRWRNVLSTTSIQIVFTGDLPRDYARPSKLSITFFAVMQILEAGQLEGKPDSSGLPEGLLAQRF
jgi:hypothetical protein